MAPMGLELPGAVRLFEWVVSQDARKASWMTRREKQWLIAYVQVAGPEPLEVAYDEAVELYEQADALDRRASDIK